MAPTPEETTTSSQTSEALASLKQQRATLKGSITRIKNQLSNIAENTNHIDLECRLEILNSYIKTIMWYQTEIEKISINDDKRAEIEELCISTKTSLLTMLGRNRPRESFLGDQTLQMPQTIRLPNLKLPKFDGKYSEFKNFYAQFKNLIHDEPNLSEIEKFNHLLSCLSGEALRTVQAFQVTEDNYSKALARLAERYDKKCLIFFDNIERVFEIPRINKPDAMELRKLVDTVSAAYDSLSTLGTQADITNALFIHLVLSKVDSGTKAKWNDQLDLSQLPTWKACAKVLIRRCQTLQIDSDRTKSIESDHPGQRKGNRRVERKSVYKSTHEQGTNDSGCVNCNSNKHKIHHYESFIALRIGQKFSFAKTNPLCLSCLRKGHSLSQCRSSRCRICSSLHHMLLHREDNSSSMSAVESSQKTKDSTHSTHHVVTSQGKTHNEATVNNLDTNNFVVLATAVVLIKNKSRKYKPVRAMLDSGPQVSLITSECARKLNLRREENNLRITGVGDVNTSANGKVSAVIKPRVNNHEFCAELWVINHIASLQPEVNINVADWKISSNLTLADPQFFIKQKVDILIGADIFFELLCVGQMKLSNSLPTLQKTLLGWIISRKVTPAASTIKASSHLVQTQTSLVDIDATLKKFWQLEDVAHKEKRTAFPAKYSTATIKTISSTPAIKKRSVSSVKSPNAAFYRLNGN